jgi:hypothetical protein
MQHFQIMTCFIVQLFLQKNIHQNLHIYAFCCILFDKFSECGILDSNYHYFKSSSNHLGAKTLCFSAKLIKYISLCHKITYIFTSESLYCITVQNICYIKTFWLRFAAACLLCTSTHTHTHHPEHNTVYCTI